MTSDTISDWKCAVFTNKAQRDAFLAWVRSFATEGVHGCEAEAASTANGAWFRARNEAHEPNLLGAIDMFKGFVVPGRTRSTGTKPSSF
jgi:hypothetical protein